MSASTVISGCFEVLTQFEVNDKGLTSDVGFIVTVHPVIVDNLYLPKSTTNLGSVIQSPCISIKKSLRDGDTFVLWERSRRTSSRPDTIQPKANTVHDLKHLSTSVHHWIELDSHIALGEGH